MEYNMVAHGIELIATEIKKLSVENSIVNILKEAKRSLGLNIAEPHIEKSENNMIGRLIIHFDIVVDQDNNQLFKMKLSIEGVFLAEDDADEEKFKQLISVNGAAAIIGIARGRIESITANIFNEGKIVLPFINVVDYYKSQIE